MSIFSRGSTKRKKFVEDKMKEYNTETSKNYTEIEANEKYMEQKKTWANDIILALKEYCEVLCDPHTFWRDRKNKKNSGRDLFYRYLAGAHYKINDTMTSDKYKNVKQGGSSSKYLEHVQFEIAKVVAKTLHSYPDPEGFKSSMESCGKGLSKLKHPIGSTALVKVGKAGKRIVDYVDELAHLMKNNTVRENVSRLVKLNNTDEWPADTDKYKYATVQTKYVEL